MVHGSWERGGGGDPMSEPRPAADTSLGQDVWAMNARTIHNKTIHLLIQWCISVEASRLSSQLSPLCVIPINSYSNLWLVNLVNWDFGWILLIFRISFLFCESGSNTSKDMIKRLLGQKWGRNMGSTFHDPPKLMKLRAFVALSSRHFNLLVSINQNLYTLLLEITTVQFLKE